MDAVLIASLALVGVVVSPLLLSWLNNRQRHRDNLADWERQDLVAERLEKRQDAAAAKTAEVARLLVQTDQRATAANAGVNGQLKAIHGLVNSNLTAAIADQLIATEAQLALLTEVSDLRRAAGHEPSPEASTTKAKIEQKVAELRAQVADRAAQTKVADAQVAGT